jgi:hypothetical protein
MVNYMLSNGVVFEGELLKNEVEVAARVSDRTLIMLDTLVWERGANRVLREAQCSKLSAAVVYAARMEEFRNSKRAQED